MSGTPPEDAGAPAPRDGGGGGGGGHGAGKGGGNGDSAPGAARAQPAAGSIRVTVNGEPASLPAGTTVADLLAARGAAGKPCAVEINRDIVPRSQHAAHALADGDAVEIVSFVGGG